MRSTKNAVSPNSTTLLAENTQAQKAGTRCVAKSTHTLSRERDEEEQCE